MKRCNICELDKPRDDFYFNRRGIIMPTCKVCRKERNIRWKNENIEQRRKLVRVANRKAKAQRYGLTLAEYEELKRVQEGRCAICRWFETRQVKGVVCELSIDHCHTTGRVRGLLCNRCNRLVGTAGDSIAVLLAAVEYLRREYELV